MHPSQTIRTQRPKVSGKVSGKTALIPGGLSPKRIFKIGDNDDQLQSSNQGESTRVLERGISLKATEEPQKSYTDKATFIKTGGRETLTKDAQNAHKNSHESGRVETYTRSMASGSTR